MKVINIMLSRSLGGIQQAFCDYSEALSLGGLRVINISSSRSAISKYINLDYNLPNLGQFDIFSAIYLAYIIRKEKPQAIIAHGNRALKLLKIFSSSVPIIGIAHNYSVGSLKKCSYIIALTKHMQSFLIKEGVSSTKIVLLPNMIRLKDCDLVQESREVPVIGAFGRFVKKKGFDVYLQALKILRDKKHNFQALLGGNGEEEKNLRRLSSSLGLDDIVTFYGWVDNKKHFFKTIDIFCLPSTHEPFGIILLEAMLYNKPVIATRSEGPAEMITHNQDGLLCHINSPEELSKQIAILLNDHVLRRKLTQRATSLLREKYDIHRVATKLTNFLKSI